MSSRKKRPLTGEAFDALSNDEKERIYQELEQAETGEADVPERCRR